jgi:hypothetical protein
VVVVAGNVVVVGAAVVDGTAVVEVVDVPAARSARWVCPSVPTRMPTTTRAAASKAPAAIARRTRERRINCTTL